MGLTAHRISGDEVVWAFGPDMTPARIPASGSSSSIGASEPFATTAPESTSERYA